MAGVLKKEQVKLSGTRVLSQAPLVPAASPARPAGGSGTSSPVASPASARAGDGYQARVVEQNGLNVLIEVTCECGQRIYLSCECG